jgi:hypothetical protein
LVARSVKLLACLALAAAVPATAQTFGFSLQPRPRPASRSADTAYRVAATMLGADVTVRLDPAAAAPDIRIALAESADAADFVLVDDGNAAPACHNGARARRVRIDAAAATPRISSSGLPLLAPADYRIYVRSRCFSPEAAAALFAAAHAPGARKPPARSRHSVRIEPIALARRQP